MELTTALSKMVRVVAVGLRWTFYSSLIELTGELRFATRSMKDVRWKIFDFLCSRWGEVHADVIKVDNDEYFD